MSYTDTELTTMRMRAESMIEDGAFDTDELLELLSKLIPAPAPIGKLTGMVIGLAYKYIDPDVRWHVKIDDKDPDCAWLHTSLAASDGHEWGGCADFRIADATRHDFEDWAARKIRSASRALVHAHADYIKKRR